MLVHSRFPQKDIIDNFCVLGMRTINWESSPDTYGNEEIEGLLAHYGEEKVCFQNYWCYLQSYFPSYVEEINIYFHLSGTARRGQTSRGIKEIC